MEKCKFCEAELEEGKTLCPACGKDNAEVAQEPVEQAQPQDAAAEEAAPAAEEAPASEEKKTDAQAEKTPGARKGNSGKLALAIAAVVVLVAVLIALVMNGLDKSAAPNLRFDDTASQEDSVPATTVPDGDASNETCKGSYTATNKQVLKNADVVVATAGDHQLTLGQLQIYYWQEVGGWINQYGAYAAYFGLDYTQPLDTQACPIMQGRTWQQFFLASSINSWRTYVALDAEAEAAGFQLDPVYQESLMTMPEQMEQEATSSGFESAQALMEFNVGVGSTLQDYLDFVEIYYHGYSYYDHFYTTATATDEEIEATFIAHEAEYAQSGLTKDTRTVDVRHILIMPAEDTEEGWAAAEATANDLLEQWLAGDMTEESFGQLATAHTQDPGSQNTGGLYTDVEEGTMVTAFNDWCFDPARQTGDTDVVKTEYGYHVMYYVSHTLVWKDLVKEDVISEKTNAMADAAVAKLPLTVDYSKILLSNAERFSGEEEASGVSAKLVFVLAVVLVSGVCVAALVLLQRTSKRKDKVESAPPAKEKSWAEEQAEAEKTEKIDE